MHSAEQGLAASYRHDIEDSEHDYAQQELDLKQERTLKWRLRGSYFLFGLINNVLYVIILSAALDLVPPSTPKGIIAFCNIFPALIAKIGWPYLLKGRIRYARRLIACSIISSVGMLVVAAFDSLTMRLLGIMFASFSSGLGELTFLQLTTQYAPPSIAGQSLGYFASGTGAAGLVGAGLWWELRGLGVRIGVGISAVLPAIIPISYFFLLPPSSAFLYSSRPSEYDDMPPTAYTAVPASLDVDGEEEGSSPAGPKRVSLTLSDKLDLVRPMLFKYMLPLFAVYLFEYTINQGISPTLIYPVPPPDKLLSKLIHSIRDYYPLWQLVYQTTVFFSRSSLSIGIPALPSRFLPLPAILQGLIFLALAYESAVGFFSEESPGLSFAIVFLLISLEGICGGLAYVNVFYHINQEAPDPNAHDIERMKQAREFKIGSVGFSDSTGILFASLLAVPTELELCKAQVRHGRMFCRGL
ncbi:batten's disease protein Cln3 [Mycena floridula]|nr:batten's disease protein Cln3 [Mycena floridula]